MRWLFASLLLCVSLAVAGVTDRPRAPRPGDRLRVATFNIHKGADGRNHYDLQRTIAAIAALDADLVGVQEAMRNDPAFNCDDQPAMMAAGLTRLTGRPWTHIYGKAWITGNRACQRQGRGDDVATEGLALLAPGRIMGATSFRLSEGRIGLGARLAAMPDIGVILTHLSANRQNQQDRAHEIQALLPWATRRAARILMGDLNALPDAAELAPLAAAYRDAWMEAAQRGLTRGVQSGATRPGRRGARIDYVFYAPDADLTLESVEVVDTSAPFALTEVSDHRPVVATFRRGAPRGR